MERNRESAQLSRDRKKVQVASLEAENGRLMNAFLQSELERNHLIQKVRELSERLDRVNSKRDASPPLSPSLSTSSKISTSSLGVPSSLMNIGLPAKSSLKTINTGLRTVGDYSLISSFNSLHENKFTVFGLSASFLTSHSIYSVPCTLGLIPSSLYGEIH